MVPFLASLWRALIWCFLASLAMASMEALGHFLTVNPAAPLPFHEFFGHFSNACAVFLMVTVSAWLLLSFFMVWLGGVRSGMALFFMLFFFMLYAYLGIVLDAVIDFTGKYAAERSLLMGYFGAFALSLAALVSMVLAKLQRRFRPVGLPALPFAGAALLLAAAAFAVWARNGGTPRAQGAHFWWFFAAAAVLLALFLWRMVRTPRRQALLFATLIAAVFAPAAVFRLTASPPPNTEHGASAPSRPVRHVILITVDTLRRDALAPYNGNPESSPRLDEFSRDTAVFTNAFSTAPWTYPSVTSILTGLPPRVHGLYDCKNALPKSAPTMAEAMEKAGYKTAALGSNHMLMPSTGLDRGFGEYLWYPHQRLDAGTFGFGLSHSLLAMAGMRRCDAERLTDQAVQWLGQNAENDFFFWIHYLDPHIAYKPPEPFQPKDPALRAMGSYFGNTWAGRAGSVARTAEERRWVRALYDGDVLSVDAQIGRLLDHLKKLGLYDDALIVLTADHGEEFWDHDRFEHGHTLYNELVRVPFMVKGPGIQAGLKIETAVTNRAVMPTVLGLCAVPNPGEGILLPPLAPLLQGQPDGYAQEPLFIGNTVFHGQMEGVVFDHMKYTRETLSGHEQLFNLRDDPEELHSLVSQDPANLEKGRQLLDAAVAADARLSERLGIGHDGKDRMDQEGVDALRSMGYL